MGERQGDRARPLPLRGRGFAGFLAVEAEAVFAVDDEDAGSDHDQAAHQRLDGRDIGKEQIARRDREQQRGVFERRHHAHVGMAIGFGEQDLRDAAGDTFESLSVHILKRGEPTSLLEPDDPVQIAITSPVAKAMPTEFGVDCSPHRCGRLT